MTIEEIKPGEVYSTGDVAELLGYTTVTIGNWIKKEQLVASRIRGGNYIIRGDNLLAFLGNLGLLPDVVVEPLPDVDAKKLLRRAERNERRRKVGAA